MPNTKRPLSPHLQVYRWELHMVLSILHRASGLVMGLGLLLLAWWAWALASGEEAYETFQAYAFHPLGRLVLFGFTYALAFHALNGVRHLFWDIGQGFGLKEVRRSGFLVVFLSIVLTIAIWVLAYYQGGRL